MAITVLPYPSMDFTPLDVLTASELDQMVSNIETINNASITTSAIANDAVTPAKIDASTYGRFERDNDGGSQTYSANTAATALLPNSVIAEVGCSYSSGIITVSQAGTWLITGGARAGSGTSYGAVRLKVNGTTVAFVTGTGYANSSVSTTYNGCVSWVGHLDASDTINLEVESYLSLTNNTTKQQHLEGVCIHID